MPILLKIRFEIKKGSLDDFKTNQAALCSIMSDDHPGVICYHVDYPEENVSEWTEIYANNDAFKAHLANEKIKEPVGVLSGACDKIICRCWGNPDEETKEILAGYNATYEDDAPNAFIVNPKADMDSKV